MFYKVNSVSPLDNYKLLVHFWNGVTKIYNINSLFKKWPAFQTLKDKKLFNEVIVDEGGYGVSWNDDIDLSCNELWENGKVIETKFDNILSFGDASKIWGLNESTLRKAITYGKLVKGIDVCKYGKQWLITTDAMKREYSNPPCGKPV